MEGDLDRAVELYKNFARDLSRPRKRTRFSGWTYHFQGKIEDAIAECKRAIEVDPDFGNPYNDIGAYLISLERYDEAIPWLERAIEARATIRATSRFQSRPRLCRERHDRPRARMFSGSAAHRTALHARPPAPSKISAAW